MRSFVRWSLILLLLSPASGLAGFLGGDPEQPGEPVEQVIRKVAAEHRRGLIISSEDVLGLVAADVRGKPADEAFAQLSAACGLPSFESNGIVVFTGHERLDLLKARPVPTPIENPRRISLDFTRADVRDLVRIIARQSGFNLVMCHEVQGGVTVRIDDLPWPTVLHHAVIAAGYDLVVRGRTVLIASPRRLDEFAGFPEPAAHDGRWCPAPATETIDVHAIDVDARDLAKGIAAHAGVAFVAERSVTGNFSVELDGVPHLEALHLISRGSGFQVIRAGDVFIMSDPAKAEGFGERAAHSAGVGRSGVVTGDFRDLELRELFGKLGRQLNRRILVTNHCRGRVTARFERTAAQDALTALACIHGFTLRADGDSILVTDDTARPVLIDTSVLPAVTGAGARPPVRPTRPSDPAATKADGGDQAGLPPAGPGRIATRTGPAPGTRPSAPPPPPPPLKLWLFATIGNERARLGLVHFADRLHWVQTGDVVADSFTVEKMLADQILVRSHRERLRRTFFVGGGR